MGMCQYCRSVVPFSVPTCVVCEGPIPGQHKPPPQVSQSTLCLNLKWILTDEFLFVLTNIAYNSLLKIHIVNLARLSNMLL